MGLEEKINEELKAAIKSGNKLRMETLRSIRASIIEFNKSGLNRTMNEDDEMKLLMTNAKKRRDAIELYEKGNRQDLADKEKSELTIIEEFLPAKISEEEVRQFVLKVISDTNAEGLKDIGRVMGPVMKELKGKADGNLVQQMVKNLLSGN